MLRLLNDADRNEVMVENKDIEEFLTAYRQGATADFIQPWQSGKWGSLWTFAPCDPTAAERVGHQMARMGATEVRWIRRGRLRNVQGMVEVMILTEFPALKQAVVAVKDHQQLNIERFLTDESTERLKSALCASLM
jgi:hypothetical protein